MHCLSTLHHKTCNAGGVLRPSHVDRGPLSPSSGSSALHLPFKKKRKTPCDRLTIVCLQVYMFVCESRFEFNCCWPCQPHYRAFRSPCQRICRWWGCPESGRRWLRTEPRMGSPPRAPGPALRSARSPSPDHLWNANCRNTQTNSLAVQITQSHQMQLAGSVVPV